MNPRLTNKKLVKALMDTKGLDMISITSATIVVQVSDKFTPKMAEELSNFTKRQVILKGDTHKENQLGMVVLDKIESTCDMVYNDKVDYVSHGTGDVFASSFVGSVMLGKSPTAACKIAGEFTKIAIEKTIGDETHTYGVKFEQAIPQLYDLLDKY